VGNDDALQLSAASLAAIGARGVPVPTYRRQRLDPRIVHIGVGGFHRAHLAAYTHDLAELGGDWGIRGLGLLAGDAAMAEALTPQNHLYSLVARGAGEPATSIVGSLVDYRHTAGRAQDTVETLADPTVAIVSLTITESGYAPADDGDSTFALVARALDRRRRTGAPPVTILSCDNLPGNGDVARRALLGAAERFAPDAVAWIETECSFPNSMVDRITPVTTAADRKALLDRVGIVDRWPVVAEPFRQWVVEDRFVAGRPEWERVGALFSDDVHAWELYKLRLLNAGHSCIAYLSALAGLTDVADAVTRPEVDAFLSGLLLGEAAPALTPIPGHPAAAYVATVLERFANPGIGDQIARLCIDGTAKFPTFLVPTIEHHLASGGPIDSATLALAGWARYLATVPPDQQAADASGDVARGYAREAGEEPTRFLDFAAVFPPTLRDSERFRAEFSAAAQALAATGPLAAMAAVTSRRRTS
jgi:mannitol 2-dehydrogenase